MMRSLVRPVTNVSATWSTRSTSDDHQERGRRQPQHLGGARADAVVDALVDQPGPGQRRRPRRARRAAARARTASGTPRPAPASRSSGRARTPSRGRARSGRGPGGSASTRASSSGVGARASCHPLPRMPGPEARGLRDLRRARARRRRGRRRRGSPLCHASRRDLELGERLDGVADGRGGLVVEAGEELAVRRVARHQLLVGAVVGHPSAVEEHHPVGQVEGRDAVGDDQRRCDRRAPRRSPVKIVSSVLESTALVASSRSSTRGSMSTARASAIRWRWPPERLSPRSPTLVS